MCSDRFAARGLHVLSHMCIEIPKTLPQARVAIPDYKACHDIDTALEFAAEVNHWKQQLDSHDLVEDSNPTSFSSSLSDAFSHASCAVLPTRKYAARRPEISLDTLNLISKRDVAHADGDFVKESNLSRRMKTQVKRDRAQWQCNRFR